MRFAAQGAGEVTVIGRTSGKSKCSGGGWYYDDPKAPTKIILCTATCEQIQAEFDGAIEIQLGCETEIVPIL